MFTAANPREMPSRTTCSRWPSGNIASTNGWLRSIRRPLDLSIRSTSSCTCAVVRMVVVSSCRPARATNTRDGSLIQISSTSGSSRYACSGPNPATRATSSPTTPLASATGATTPVRLRSSCARTTSSARWRTSATSRCGSTPSRRTASRTCASRSSTSEPAESPPMCRAGELLAHTDHFPRSFDQLLLVGGASGKRLRRICGQWYASDQRRSRPAPGADSRWVGTTPPTAAQIVNDRDTEEVRPPFSDEARTGAACRSLGLERGSAHGGP